MNTYAERTEKTASEKDKTGIPRRMKKGFEHSSGFSFDDVRVHYNSEKPAQLHAHAYTQGNEVYVAPGQEKHLPHELGHVVQQKSDMVKPTGEIGGLPLNDDEAMENSADMIAENAETAEELGDAPVQAKFKGDVVVQRNAVDTQESYNAWAGFGSTFVGMLGIAGGIGSFLYTKHNDRKHRYIEEIEKYADAACDAREEQIAALKLSKNRNLSVSEKASANAEASKQSEKIRRNYKAAIKKAFVMAKPLIGKNQDADNVNEDNIDQYIGKIEDQNVKFALERARKAYRESRGMVSEPTPQEHPQEQQQEQPQDQPQNQQEAQPISQLTENDDTDRTAIEMIPLNEGS